MRTQANSKFAQSASSAPLQDGRDPDLLRQRRRRRSGLASESLLLSRLHSDGSSSYSSLVEYRQTAVNLGVCRIWEARVCTLEHVRRCVSYISGLVTFVVCGGCGCADATRELLARCLIVARLAAYCRGFYEKFEYCKQK